VLVQAVQCGISIDQFWSMTWREWSIYSIAHQRTETNEWARTRRVAYMVYLMGSGEKTKMNENRFHPLPIDEPEYKGEPLTPEEIKRSINLYSKKN